MDAARTGLPVEPCNCLYQLEKRYSWRLSEDRLCWSFMPSEERLVSGWCWDVGGRPQTSRGKGRRKEAGVGNRARIHEDGKTRPATPTRGEANQTRSLGVRSCRRGSEKILRREDEAKQSRSGRQTSRQQRPTPGYTQPDKGKGKDGHCLTSKRSTLSPPLSP